MSRVKSVFPILILPLAHEVGSIPAKVGELELEINCVYDPTLKLQARRNHIKDQQNAKQENGHRAAVAEQHNSHSNGVATAAVNPGGQTKPTSAGSKIDEMLLQAELLRKRMIVAEHNHKISEERQLHKDLYDGGAFLADPTINYGLEANPAPKSKEAELARFRLQMDSFDLEGLSDLQDKTEKAESGYQIEQKYELQFSDIEKLKVQVHDIKITDQLLSKVITKDATMSLVLKFPKLKALVAGQGASQPKSGQQATDQVSFAAQPEELPETGRPTQPPNNKHVVPSTPVTKTFRVDKEAKISYCARDLGVESLSSGKIEVLLELRASKHDTHPPLVAKAVIASGTTTFDELLNSINFQKEFELGLDTSIALNEQRGKGLFEILAAADSRKAGTAEKSGSKSKQPSVAAPLKRIGSVGLTLAFISDKVLIIPRPFVKPAEPPVESFTGTNHLKPVADSKLMMETRLLDDKTSAPLPVCLLMHVIRGSKIPSRSDGSQRNVFLQHKVYPTPDDVVSHVFWNQTNPEFDHRMTIPLTESILRCTKESPLTISVWDRRTPTLSVSAHPASSLDGNKGDEVIGVVHLSLQSVFGLLGALSIEQLNAMLANQELNVLEISKKYHALEHLVPPSDYKAHRDANSLGFLKIFLGVGNIRQITEYNSRNPGNNSQMLGIEPVSKGLMATTDWEQLFPTEEVVQTRDPSLKKVASLTAEQKRILGAIPSLKTAVRSLLDALNEGNVTPEKVSADLKVLMERQSDAEVVEVLREVGREAHRCNPLIQVDYSRKNYLRLGDFQLVFDKTARKYMQLFNQGERTPMDKCEFVRRDGTKELLFVDPTVLKCARNQFGERILTKQMCQKLAKYGRIYKFAVQEMKVQLEREKSFRREERRLKKEIEERAEELERRKLQMAIDEVQRKAKEKELVEVEWRKREEILAKKKAEEAAAQHQGPGNQPQDGGGARDGTAATIIPKTGTLALKPQEVSQGENSKGWKALKSKLSTISKGNAREDESYLEKSNKDINSVVMVSPRKKAGFSFKTEGQGSNKLIAEDGQPNNRNSDGNLVQSNPSAQPTSILRGLRESAAPRSGFEVIKIGMVLGVATMQQPDTLRNNSKTGRQVGRATFAEGVNDSRRNTVLHESTNLAISSQRRTDQLAKSDLRDYSSSDASEDHIRMKNLNVLGEDDENYDTTVVVKQYETELVPGFESQDLLQNFTMLLEYMRRTLHASEKMKKNLKFLLLGLYQSHNHKDIMVEDFESIMETYTVPMSKREVLPIFNFLDLKEDDTIDLGMFHDALVAYMSMYKTYHSQYEGTFKYIFDKIENEPKGLSNLEAFLIEHSENYHIDHELVENYLQSEFLIPEIDLVSTQLEEYCGFLYFDKVYIINLLNILYFLEKSQQVRVNPQKVNTFHTYDSFVPLVLQKVREALSKNDGADQKLEAIGQELLQIEREFGEGARKKDVASSPKLSRKNTLLDIEFTASIDFKQFRELLLKFELDKLSIYEMMLLFSFARSVSERNRQVINHEQTVSLGDLQVFFFIVLSDATVDDVESLYGRQITGTLAQFINREKLFANKAIMESGKLVLPKKKKNLLLSRRKMRSERVETDRILYRVTVNVQAVEDLALPAVYEYSELSLSFNFPGEEEPFESQIFTFIPHEPSYDVLLNTEHTYRCPESVDIAEIFAEAKYIKISLNQVRRGSTIEVAAALVPFRDIVAAIPSTKVYFLFPTAKEDAFRQDGLHSPATHRQPAGSVRLAFAFHVSTETLSQKDFFFSKRYLLNNHSVEKDCVFERDVPISGSLLITCRRVHSFRGFYNLLELAKRHCMFGRHEGKVIVTVLLRVKEIQKDETKAEDLELSRSEHPPSQFKPMQRGFTSYVTEPDEDRLFMDFAIELKSAQVGSADSLFTFLDSVCSTKSVPLYSVRKFDIHLNSTKMALMSSSEVEFGLYLAFGGPVPHREEKICAASVDCSTFLTLQNLKGSSKTLQLKSPKMEDPLALVDMNLNFTKVHMDDSYLNNLAKFKEIENVIDKLRARELAVHLSHLLVLRKDCCAADRISTLDTVSPEDLRAGRAFSDSHSGQDKLFFLIVRVGKWFYESTLAIDPKDSEDYQLSATANPVLNVKLGQRKHKNLLHVRFQDFLSDVSLDKLFEEYVGLTEDIPSLTEFVLSHLPDLEIFMREVNLGSHSPQEHVSSITVSLENIFRCSIDPSVAGFPLVGFARAYLPLEASDSGLLGSTGVRKLRHTSTANKQQAYVLQPLEQPAHSATEIQSASNSPQRETNFIRARVGLKLMLLNTKGSLLGSSTNTSTSLISTSAIIPASGTLALSETLDIFKSMISLDWLRDPEKFATKLSGIRTQHQNSSPNHGVSISEGFVGFEEGLLSPPQTSVGRQRLGSSPKNNDSKDKGPVLDWCDQGLTIDKNAFAQLLVHELKVPLLQASVLTAMLGQSPKRTDHANLFYLVDYPFDPAHTFEPADVPASLVSEVLSEFQHLDTSKSGLVDFGEAFKLVMSYSTNFNLGVRQIQAFKYRDFMRDVRDSIDRQTLKRLEIHGFDYLLFLYQVQEVVRRWPKSQMSQTGSQRRVISFDYQLQQLQHLGTDEPVAFSDSHKLKGIRRDESLQSKSRLSESLKGKSILHDKHNNRYVLSFKVLSATGVNILTKSSMPNTTIQISSKIHYGLEKSDNFDKFSEIVWRDSDPEWGGLQTTLVFRDLEGFIRSDPEAALQIKIYERSLKLKSRSTDTMESLVDLKQVGMMDAKIFRVLTEPDLVSFLANSRASSLHKEYILKYPVTQTTPGDCAVRVAFQLDKDDNNQLANATEEWKFASLDRFEVDLSPEELVSAPDYQHLKQTLAEIRQHDLLDRPSQLLHSRESQGSRFGHYDTPWDSVANCEHPQDQLLDAAIQNLNEALENIKNSDTESEGVDIDEQFMEYKVDILPQVVVGKESLAGEEKSEEYNSRQSFGVQMNQTYQQGNSNSRYGSELNIQSYNPAPSLRAEPTAKFGDVMSTHEIEVFESDMGTPSKPRQFGKRNSVSLSNRVIDHRTPPLALKSPDLQITGLSGTGHLARISERSKDSHRLQNSSLASDTGRQGNPDSFRPRVTLGVEEAGWPQTVPESSQAEHDNSPVNNPQVSQFFEARLDGSSTLQEQPTFQNLSAN